MNLWGRQVNQKIYITNLKNSNKDLVAEAIKNTGRTDIHIDDKPFTFSKQGPGDEYFSIYVYGSRRDCSDFWREYDRLSESIYWKTYRALVDD